MTSWRESVSEAAQSDLDRLLSAALDLAEQLVTTNGEMYPFGAAVSQSGNIEYVAPPVPEAGEKPSSATILRACDDTLRSRLDQLRAVGVACDVATSDGEALEVTVEHSEGIALQVLLPYVRDATGAVREFGALSAAVEPCRFWPVR